MKLFKFKCLFLFLGLLTGLLTWAQPELGECEQEVHLASSEQIPKALKAWKRNDLLEAKRYLDKALSLDENNAHANYLLGELYLKKGQLLGTEASWEKVLKACPEYKADLLYYLGVLLVETGKETRGLELLGKYLKHPERDPELVVDASQIFEEKQVAAKLKSNPLPFNPIPVRGISTPDDEYLGCLSPDMEWFFFTRKLKRQNKYAGPAAGTRLVEEFSLSQKSKQGFGVGEALTAPFNDRYNEGGPSVTADNRELYFTVCQPASDGYLNCDIWYSRRVGQDWDLLKPLSETINKPNSWESQPSVSANGDLLFFASNREGGVGKIDLYLCERLENGQWSNPKNLGKTVNTSENEKTPFIHSDSRTLYFSSDGHPGLGGYDIFFTKMEAIDQFTKPENIGYPINDEGEDVGLFVSLDGQFAYFSKKHQGNRKDYDIFSFELPPQAKPDKVALVKGSVSNEAGKPNPDAQLKLKNLSNSTEKRLRIDEVSGNYAAAVNVSNGQSHLLVVEQPNIAFSSKHLGEEDAGVVVADLEAAKLEKGREYRLNDIRFASNSAELNSTSKAVLNAFVSFLKAENRVKAEIQGHTDDVGADEANLKLSAERAKVVYDYLISQGIAPIRLKHKGYGESRPIAPNENENGRAKNRRTVFVLSSE